MKEVVSAAFANNSSKKSLQADGHISQYFAQKTANPLAEAFDGKIAMHPGVGGKPLSPSEVTTLVEKLSNLPRSGKSVAYIHVPVCETHCLYCGFYRKPQGKDFSKLYADTLIKEVELWAGREVYTSSPIHAVYFGGGTPTALEAKDLERILLCLKKHLNLANDCEITIEGRLYNFDERKMEACFRGGANRFSLGVQTFDTAIRKKMGRIETKESASKKLELLKSYDNAAVIIDLIYGFPNQTMDIWLEDIAIAHSLKLDGCDCYQLNVYDATPLGKAILDGKVEKAADIKTQSAMFEASVKAMQDNFYRRLSVSHWARTSRERNLYNLYTKGLSSGLFFGPGAGGNLNGNFIINAPDVQKWTELIESGVKPAMMLQKSPKNNMLYKRITEYMEQMWLDFDDIKKEFNIDILKALEQIVKQWESVGLVSLTNNKMILTLSGQFWQVNLAQLILHRLKNVLEDK